jgi:hypothetical protein
LEMVSIGLSALISCGRWKTPKNIGEDGSGIKEVLCGDTTGRKE